MLKVKYLFTRKSGSFKSLTPESMLITTIILLITLAWK